MKRATNTQRSRLLWAVTILGAAVVFGSILTLKRCHGDDQHREQGQTKQNSQAPHDMDMTAGDSLQNDFAHRELIVLESVPEVPATFERALGDIYHDYLKLHAAFVEPSSESKTIAQRMGRAVAELSTSGLSVQAAKAWESHSQVLRTSLHQIQESVGLITQRAHFSHVSEAMYCALRSFGGIGHPVHVLYCPMAFDGKGAYWLSDRREVRNPYMGRDMLACGEVRETIPSTGEPGKAR